VKRFSRYRRFMGIAIFFTMMLCFALFLTARVGGGHGYSGGGGSGGGSGGGEIVYLLLRLTIRYPQVGIPVIIVVVIIYLRSKRKNPARPHKKRRIPLRNTNIFARPRRASRSQGALSETRRGARIRGPHRQIPVHGILRCRIPDRVRRMGRRRRLPFHAQSFPTGQGLSDLHTAAIAGFRAVHQGYRSLDAQKTPGVS